MKAIDDQGREIDALFRVEPTVDGAHVILESRGGGEGGPRPPRNAGYAQGLELLLTRLGQHDAVLTGVEVYSRDTQGWPIEARRLSTPSFPLPLSLAALTDVQGFRRQLGRASAALGRAPEKTTGGNPTKRLRLTVLWPEAVGRLSSDLEDLLAASARSEPAASERAGLLYAPLGTYLRSKTDNEVRLRLSEISNLIGRTLPSDAWTPQFWANTDHHLSRRGQWLNAGFKARFEVRTETVLFTRAVSSQVLQREQPTADPEELRKRVAAAWQRRKVSAKSSQTPPSGQADVASTTGTVRRFIRDPEVIAWVLAQAAGDCEVCNTKAPFYSVDGEPFLEVHHVRPLGEGGPDQIDNAVAACPNCHRRLHYGADREAIRTATVQKVSRLTDYPQKLVAEVVTGPS